MGEFVVFAGLASNMFKNNTTAYKSSNDRLNRFCLLLLSIL